MTANEVRAALEIQREQSLSAAIRRRLPYLVERAGGEWRQCPWLMAGKDPEERRP